MSPLQSAFHARARADLRLPPHVSLADAVRSNAHRATLHGLIAERCAPSAPDTDVVPIGESTLRRLLLGKTAFAKAKTNTRDAIARYVGYENFADFERAHVTAADPAPALDPEPAAPDATIAVPDAPMAPAAPPATRWPYAAAAALVALTTLGYFTLEVERPTQGASHASTPAADLTDAAFATHVHDLIRDYNRAEFALYEAVPDLSDTAALLAYAWADGGAYASAHRVATRSAAVGNRLDRRRSNRQLIDCRLVSRTDSTCLLATTEQWTLIWERPDGSTVEYDEVNDQRYGLRERDGTWKVFANGYTGTNTVTAGASTE